MAKVDNNKAVSTSLDTVQTTSNSQLITSPKVSSTTSALQSSLADLANTLSTTDTVSSGADTLQLTKDPGQTVVANPGIVDNTTTDVAQPAPLSQPGNSTTAAPQAVANQAAHAEAKAEKAELKAAEKAVLDALKNVDAAGIFDLSPVHKLGQALRDYTAAGGNINDFSNNQFVTNGSNLQLQWIMDNMR